MGKIVPCQSIQNSATLRVIALLRFFIGLVCLLFFFLGAWEVWDAREEGLEKGRVDAGNLAAALALQMETGSDKLSLMLGGMTERILWDGMSTPASRERLYRLSRMRVQTSMDVISIDVFDAEGDRVNAVSFPEKTVGTNIRNTPLFLHIPPQKEKTYIGIPVFEPTLEQWMLPLSQRVVDQNGNLLAVVVAGVSLEYLRSNYSRLTISKGDSIVVALNGVPFCWRLPAGTSFTQDRGDQEKLKALFADLKLLKSGEIARSPMDGQERLYATDPLEKFPMTVSVGLAVDNVLHGWRLSAIRQSAITLLLLVCVLLMGRKLLSLLRLLMAREDELESAGERLKGMNMELERLARQDTLTGLANRRTMMEMLELELGRSVRHGEPLSIAMADVDFFKLYNDTYGHVAGDVCLKKIASVLQGVVRRPGDLAARYGGEEFLLLLPGATSEAAMDIVESALEELRRLSIPHSKSTIGVVTFSAGVYTLEPDQEVSVEAAVKKADLALYRAKGEGRNKVCLYGSGN